MPRLSFLQRQLALRTAKSISKADFIAQLKPQYAPLIRADTDIETELRSVLSRIKDSGFQEVFDVVGVTEDDIRQALKEIQAEKM